MDKRLYHADWSDVIRPAILKRDGYKCRNCGIRHKSRVYKNARGGYIVCDEFTENWALSQGVKVFTVYLNVAHIDNDKGNNEPENLISLCPRHHSIFDAEHKRTMRKAYKSKVLKADNELIKKFALDRAKVLRGISDLVKEFTGCGIHLHEADSIYNFIIKNTENE